MCAWCKKLTHILHMVSKNKGARKASWIDIPCKDCNVEENTASSQEHLYAFVEPEMNRMILKPFIIGYKNSNNMHR